MIGKKLLDVFTTFLGVLLCLMGTGIAAGGVAWAALGRGDQALWYLAVGAAFITLGVLLFRWHPYPQAQGRVPIAGEKEID